jgi:cytochrome c biogenesis protein ResB
MASTAFWISIFSSLAVSLFLCFLPLFLSGERRKAAGEKAHARRLTDARRNARLLRLNL